MPNLVLESTCLDERTALAAKNSVYVFQYSHIKRLFAVICFLLMIFAGSFFIFVNTTAMTIFGTLLILAALVNTVDILFFKVLTIDSEHLTKEWYLFGSRSIKTSNLTAISTKKLWEGSIIFCDKTRYRVQTFYMNFETFPANDKAYERMREALRANGVISGDEACWNSYSTQQKSIWRRVIKRIKHRV